MRKARVVLREQNAFYHCTSKTVNGAFLFRDPGNKEVVQRILHRVAFFSGVKVLTYCLMDNHFHILVQIPEKRLMTVTDEELIERYAVLYSVMEPHRQHDKAASYAPSTVAQIKQTLRNGGEDAQEMRERLFARMYDLSEFMKTFKQRVTTWYNATFERFGPLWYDRFHSVLVQGKKNVLLIMAAYIDLNPVRARLVKDPADYLFCGYGEAVQRKSGNCRLGIATICGATLTNPQDEGDWQSVQDAYRQSLYGQGSAPRRSGYLLTKYPPKPPPEITSSGCETNQNDFLLEPQPGLERGLIFGEIPYLQKLEELSPQEVSFSAKPRPLLETKNRIIGVGRLWRSVKSL